MPVNPSNNLPTALVTGATNGIGAALTLRLLSSGYTVYGIGRTFDGSALEAGLPTLSEAFRKQFHFLPIDLSETASLSENPTLDSLQHRLTLLVNNAGCAYYGLHEELSPKSIREMLAVNLEAPLLLTNRFLRTLKETGGTVLNVSSVTATHAAPRGAAYGATKAGLSAFSKSLFEEARKYGVRVITLQPDMTDTNLYRNADFTCSDVELERLTADEIADAAMFALTQRNGLDMTELTIRPQINRIKRREAKP